MAWGMVSKSFCLDINHKVFADKKLNPEPKQISLSSIMFLLWE